MEKENVTRDEVSDISKHCGASRRRRSSATCCSFLSVVPRFTAYIGALENQLRLAQGTSEAREPATLRPT
eukprot:1791842-Amphidinium_carterae.1